MVSPFWSTDMIVPINQPFAAHFTSNLSGYMGSTGSTLKTKMFHDSMTDGCGRDLTILESAHECYMAFQHSCSEHGMPGVPPPEPKFTIILRQTVRVLEDMPRNKPF